MSQLANNILEKKVRQDNKNKKRMKKNHWLTDRLRVVNNPNYYDIMYLV